MEVKPTLMKILVEKQHNYRKENLGNSKAAAFMV